MKDYPYVYFNPNKCAGNRVSHWFSSIVIDNSSKFQLFSISVLCDNTFNNCFFVWQCIRESCLKLILFLIWSFQTEPFPSNLRLKCSVYVCPDHSSSGQVIIWLSNLCKWIVICIASLQFSRVSCEQLRGVNVWDLRPTLKTHTNLINVTFWQTLLTMIYILKAEKHYLFQSTVM